MQSSAWQFILHWCTEDEEQRVALAELGFFFSLLRIILSSFHC